MPPTHHDPTPDTSEQGWRKAYRKAMIRMRVWREAPVARGRLAEVLGLNLPTVSSCVAELLAEGDLVERGYADSTGGRKAQLLEMNPSSGSVIGVTYSSRGVGAAWADMRGDLRNVVTIPLSTSVGKEKVLSTLRSAIADQLEEVRRNPVAGPVRLIGVGISGLLDAAAGVSEEFPRFEEWRDVPLRAIIEEWFGVPTVLDGRVAAITLAEAVFGLHAPLHNALYVQLGPGLGMGIVIDGRLYRGSRQSVGEFGHTTITDGGPICYCGNYGCLESQASDYALVQQAEAGIREGVSTRIGDYAQGGAITPAAIFQAADAGDRFAANLVERVARLLGAGIANLVNLFAPEVVIVGGTMAEAGDVLMNPLCATVRTRALEQMEKDVQIRLASFGLTEAIKGATTMALHHHLARDIEAVAAAGRPQF